MNEIIVNGQKIMENPKDPDKNIQEILIVVTKKNRNRSKRRKKSKYQALEKPESYNKLTRFLSYSDLAFESVKHIRSSELSTKRSRLPNYIVSNESEQESEHSTTNKNAFINPVQKPRFKVYRCQMNTQEEGCCCNCNSDAMFEVMKSLYDCYKKKNCDNCNCILCGHLPREERRLAEMRKSTGRLTSIPSETASAKERRKDKVKNLEKSMVGKSAVEKEKLLEEAAMKGIPLPEGKTASEKELIKKVKTKLGMPQEPKTEAEKAKLRKAEAAGMIIPLEGKSMAEKEKILKKQAELGIPLPEGRTPSEKALIQRIKTGAGLPSVKMKPSERIRKAKEAGLLTPLEGKTAEQKEKIIKGLAMYGIPLPEGKTASEKKLINKVRDELGLPPEPKTTAEKEKYAKAQAAGLIIPLEGKTPEQKEKILRGQAALGLPLPEGRTASEKALIKKIKASTKEPSIAAKPSERLRRAKAAGFVTPLEGKSQEQKEYILKGLAAHGVPLPEGKTASEKKLINKVRDELGLPPEPKTAAEKEKYNKAVAAGIIVPLEGKTNAEKEKILKAQADMGISLPEGRTPSEKALIKKIKSERKKKSVGVSVGKPALPPEKAKELDAQTAKVMTEGKGPSDECICDLLTPESERERRFPGKITSEKLRAAKAAGLLTPLEGKTPEQKERILKGLAMQGLPLPIGKTASDKKLINKVRVELGLPPEPKTQSIKEKYAKAQAAGLITPLEGKTNDQKEKILRGQAQLGIPLPEGRTPSEKALINKVKGAAALGTSLGRIPSEKIRKAKAAGLLTPLEGKTPQQKEKILKGLAKAGIPLPEPKTVSEKNLIRKVRQEVGLPPEPSTPSLKEKYRKAQAAGIITPLEGKSHTEKEKILKKMYDSGIPLPEGRTPSEKALIKKITGITPIKVPSEKLRKAKAAGFLTPLEGKTTEQKEKILRGLAKNGIPLPEGRTPSEKKIIDKVRREMGLPPEPKTAAMKEKYDRAAAAGLLTPLEGKTDSQKEKILQAQAQLGLPLPEGRTPSEKALIARVKRSIVAIPSEKFRKAKAAGFLTPLEGKTPAQKEKIMRGLAEHGLPLPEAKTASERKLMEKVRKDLGLPPEPKSAKEKKRYNKALAAGAIVPLEGKTKAQKEKILKKQAEMGIPLPEGRTKSEKALIAKIKAETKPEVSAASLVTQIPSEKLRKAQAAGLLTPLEGKSNTEKEKNLRGLAEYGLPLPEGKTKSERSLIHKVRTELGVPPVPKTLSQKEIIRKAKADGLLTPLTGKTTAQKEKILRGLAEAGLPMPEGKTPSEKALVKKVRKAAGLPPETTPSEKLGKIKKRGKKGESIKKGAKTLSAKAAGIDEELEDITKTTKCDRACGCDKKKIRFKHSYVKIRVTSPDISSLCPCPEECVPGVKHGVFTDSEGIKVTVGSAVGVPSFSTNLSNKINQPDFIYFNKHYLEESSSECTLGYSSSNKQNSYTKTTSSFIKKKNLCDAEETYQNAYSYIYDYVSRIQPELLQDYIDGCYEVPSTSISYRASVSISLISKEGTATSGSSFDSIIIYKTESSLSLRTNNETIATVSIISFVDSCSTSKSREYLCYSHSGAHSDLTTEETEYFTNIVDYSAVDALPSNSASSSEVPQEEKKGQIPNNNMHIFAMRQTDNNISTVYNDKAAYSSNQNHPILVVNDLNSDEQIVDIIDNILNQEFIEDMSSVYLMIPASDYETDCSEFSSTICIQLSENFPTWTNSGSSTYGRYVSSMGVKLSSKGRRNTPRGLLADNHDNNFRNNRCNTSSEALLRTSKTLNKQCQVKLKKTTPRARCVSVDTVSERPCCCPPKRLESNYGSNDRCVASVVSELITPMIFNEGIAQGLSEEACLPNKGSRLLEPTPVRHCKIPTCSESANAKTKPTNIRLPKSKCQPGDYNQASRSCNCCPENQVETFSNTSKPMKSTGVGCSPPVSRGNLAVLPPRANCGIPSCCNENLPTLTTADNLNKNGLCENNMTKDKKLCACKLKAKAIKFESPCLCGGRKSPAEHEQCVETPKKQACVCKDKNKNKKVICECPEEEELPIEDIDIVPDEKYMRKMKSDLTQTTSGFKLTKPKRPVEDNMSFEDALMYYKAFAEAEDVQEDESCICNENQQVTISNNMICECPDEPSEPLEEEPFRGLKISIGGKGSGSKGLTGICCFDLTQEINGLS
ncbi:uncharacterized protein LOC114246448 [Bombyx mandarina]|uniref:Uncharacterized protein LOC114246448 n=1 Tax=Bombyx mandarina TaxID=7092 RepID=A0A6J2JY16_BOMMA|nr:uncharacterized protein LOC114246448 [Bombyx mandarina]